MKNLKHQYGKYINVFKQVFENAVGNACEVFNWQDRTNLVLLKQHKFPLEADITFEMVTSGKSMKYVVKQVELPKVI
ncbi:hypothetical protein [Acinetobacter baumannii]|uniref:hypothetical protein n=1 Tax=Acinetobacter baumannii TaxID=470 RepID=UPI000A38BCB0|nr:hypothetical protein [Acinetobacter baumannii]OTT25155.1 hypothetical protein CAS81_19425 [Acinetobacter baumannii]